MKRSHFSLLGFSLFFIGVLALILSIVGLKLSFLAFLDDIGRTFGLVIKLLFVFVGMIMLYMSKSTDYQ